MIGDSSVRPMFGQGIEQGSASPRKVAGEAASPQTAAAAPADELSLSREGLLYGLFDVAPGPDGCIHVDDIRTANEATKADFDGKLSSLLKEAGVDRSEPFTLRTDAMGKVFVEGSHPDKEKIEAIFDNRPELANEFRKISATSSFLHAADEAAPFREAYARDPYAAVQRYSYLFDGSNRAEFGMQVTADAMDCVFSKI